MTELHTQYFDEIDLNFISSQVKLLSLKIISTDTYSDEEVWLSIQNTGKTELLLCSAIQMAVVGFGNKTYGSFEYKGIKYEVNELFKDTNVKMNLTLKDKVDANCLTPRRIQRLFRKQIFEFLINNENIKPYLWRKYSSRDIKYRTTTFPNAESLITDPDAIKYLYSTYKEVDKKNETNICERIKRVFEARGLFNFE